MSRMPGTERGVIGRHDRIANFTAALIVPCATCKAALMASLTAKEASPSTVRTTCPPWKEWWPHSSLPHLQSCEIFRFELQPCDHHRRKGALRAPRFINIERVLPSV